MTAPAAALMLVVAAFGVYAPSLSAPFVFDDRASIIDNRTIETLDPAAVLSPPHETPVAGRPLVNLTFALNHAAGGRDPWGYRLVNVAIHAACGLLVFGLVHRTAARLGLMGAQSDAQGGAGGVAAAAAFLWLLHPLATESVSYVTQRTESMMALFALLTLYAAARALAGGARWSWLAVGASAAGMACKESMVVVPLLVALYDRAYAFTSWRKGLSARRALYAGLAATWGLLGWLVASSPRGLSAGFSAPDAAPLTYLLNQSQVILEYLQLVVWPRDLALYWGWPLPLTAADVWPGLVLVGALAVATMATWLRRPAVGFLPLAAFLALAPTSSILPIATEVGAERRMYLPLAAIVVLGVLGARAALARFGARARGAAIVLTTLAAVTLGSLTWQRNVEYQSSLVLAQTTAERRPTPGALSMYGTELAAAGRMDEAERTLRAAAPAFPPARFYHATVLSRLGRTDDAIGAFQEYIRVEPPALMQVHTARELLAGLLLEKNRLPEAERVYRDMLATQPGDAEPLAQLASVLVRKGEYPEAIDRYKAYLARFPVNARAWTGLGVALASSGRAAEAVEPFTRASSLEPANVRYLLNLARALLSTGRRDDARAAVARAATLAPGDPDVAALAAALAVAGR